MPDTFLTRRPAVALSVAACAIILLAAVAISWMKGSASPTRVAPETKAFYSDDDGTTWFIDDLLKVVPFDHDGKSAVRVRLFRCDHGKPFVGYLERYSAADIAKATAASAGHPAGIGAALGESNTEVKKPGDAHWVATNEPMSKRAAIMNPSCPDGGTEVPAIVSPSDSNNGAVK